MRGKDLNMIRRLQASLTFKKLHLMKPKLGHNPKGTSWSSCPRLPNQTELTL